MPEINVAIKLIWEDTPENSIEFPKKRSRGILPKRRMPRRSNRGSRVSRIAESTNGIQYKVEHLLMRLTANGLVDADMHINLHHLEATLE